MRYTYRSFIAGLLMAGLLAAMQLPALAADEKQVNINAATAAELSELKGLGPAKAQAIVTHREQNGPYKSVDDLRQVKGIGDKLLAKLRPQLNVGSTTAAAQPRGK